MCKIIIKAYNVGEHKLFMIPEVFNKKMSFPEAHCSRNCLITALLFMVLYCLL